MSISDRRVIAREHNVVRVDFRREPDPSAPTFPGAGALRRRADDVVDAFTTSFDRMETAMRKGVLAASLAAALALPQVGAAAAGESGRSMLQQGDSRVLLPMPGIERVPWLASGFSLVVPQQYLAVGPRIESLGPFLLPPAVPPTQFSSSAHTAEQATATE